MVEFGLNVTWDASSRVTVSWLVVTAPKNNGALKGASSDSRSRRADVVDGADGVVRLHILTISALVPPNMVS